MERIIPAYSMGLRDIHPLFCGFDECKKGHGYGPATREYYLIHYVLDGRGIFRSGGVTYNLSRGRCFLICPGDVTFYKADDNEPWHYIWIAFSGEMAGAFLERAGLGAQNPVFGSEKISALFEAFHKELIINDFPDDTAPFFLMSKIYAFFSILPQIAVTETQREKYINKAVYYISTMYSKNISVDLLAHYCGLDRRYLSRIFKLVKGVTIQQYIMDLRMQKAHELLQFTQLSVGDIARSVGYTDVYNFSKMFKKNYGKAPLHFRKISIIAQQ